MNNGNDWICNKCSFFNFGRNTSCKECNKDRDTEKTANDWNCSECNYFNFKKNISCKQCKTLNNGENDERLARAKTRFSSSFSSGFSATLK